ISTFSSLRPLVPSASASPTKASREHRIWTAEDSVVHIAGGKYTTYRAMSEEAADLISPVRSTTASTPLGGNTKERIDELLASATGEGSHTIRHYGVQIPNMLAYLPETP